MGRSPSKPPTPEQRLRELRRDLKDVEAQAPGPERAARLAALTRAASDDRHLNAAMHTAARCLAEDPAAPALLLAAFGVDDAPTADGLEALSDLVDLARYIDRGDVVDTVEATLVSRARAWLLAAEPSERRYRLRTIQSLTSPATADRLRTEFDLT